MTEISDEKRFEYEQEISKIRIEVLKKYEEYNKTMKYIACDAPIEVLCLPKVIETILIDNGYERIYDLFDMDFTKIKGLGVMRCRDLATSLDQFLSML